MSLARNLSKLKPSTDGLIEADDLAPGAGGGAAKVQPLTASVSANAMTITASALTLDFRSTTATSGAVTTVSGTPASLVVPANQSFGIATTGVVHRYAVLCVNNAGTLALALSPLRGGVQLDETNFASVTSTVTNTLTTLFSTITASNIAYRVIGFVDIAYTSGTGYSAAPTLVQGVGGQAMTAMSSVGYGQTWQAVTRTVGTTYYNTTGRPITLVLNAYVNNTSAAGWTLTVNGTLIVNCAGGAGGIGMAQAIASTHVIPPSASYVVGGGQPSAYELR